MAANETLFRLNPEWEVLDLAGDRLHVRYERTEAEAEYAIRRHAGEASLRVDLLGASGRSFEYAWPAAGSGIRLEYREDLAEPLSNLRLAELQLWLQAVAGYLALASRNSRRARLVRWLIDRFWLRMTPTARRVSLLIVAMELLALILLVAVLLVLRWWG